MQQHPRAVAEHKDLIIDCLTDEDSTIRMRALDLISSMVSKKNIKSVVAKLMEHLQTAEGNYRDIVLDRIISICSQNDYAFVADFDWYVATLLELTHFHGKNVFIFFNNNVYLYDYIHLQNKINNIEKNI